MEKNDSSRKKPLNSYLKYSSLGMQMILTLCLAAWGGMKLDEYFGVKNNLITVFLMLFAVVGTIYLLIKNLTNDGRP